VLIGSDDLKLPIFQKKRDVIEFIEFIEQVADVAMMSDFLVEFFEDGIFHVRNAALASFQ
jgi:hypothetical protein